MHEGLEEHEGRERDPITDPVVNLRAIQFELPPYVQENWEDWKPILFSRLKYASKLDIPHLPELLPCEGRAVIVGSAPSVTSFSEEIKKLSSEEFDILMSVNATHEWLIQNIRPPNIHVFFESDIEDVKVSLGGPPHKDVVYYICSQCGPHVFEQMKDYKCVLWHVFQFPPEYQQAIARYFKGEFMVAGAWGTLFRCINIAIVLGYRKFELFGCDSSFEGDSDHIPGYKKANLEKTYNIWGVDEITNEARKFRSTGCLAFQAYEFLKFCEVNHESLSIRVYGDSLLRYIHKSRYPKQYET